MVKHLPAFLAISALVIMTPGQDTALTIRNTLRAGRAGGVFTALGVASGQAVWTLAASVGIAALLRSSSVASTGIRLAGAAYLMLLGVGALRAAVRSQVPRLAAVSEGGLIVSSRIAFSPGAPQQSRKPQDGDVLREPAAPFASPTGPTSLTLALLGLVFCSLTLVWLAGYAVVVARARKWLGRPTARRALEALTGSALVALGLRLVVERA
jgi:threonine/homoserine/homoserine lactone efflux protein